VADSTQRAIAEAPPVGHTRPVIAAIHLIDILGFGGVAAVCLGMLWLSSRIEPHWASKDGSRFLTTANELDQWNTPVGRKHEVRCSFDDEALMVRRRSMLRPSADLYFVEAKVPNPPRGRQVYLLKKLDEASTDRPRLALRVPANSKVVGRLDALLR